MSSVRLTGRVKWFNRKSGYGFLTVCGDSLHKDKDIFVHFSAVNGENDQYKYLVQGEYVDFDLVESKGDAHEFQAASITGVMGGLTMCETHRNNPRPNPRERSGQERPNAKVKHGRRDSYGESDDGYTDVRRPARARVSNRY